MTSHTARPEFAMQARLDVRGEAAPLVLPLPSFDATLARGRAFIARLRRSPHDALAMLVLSCVGSYFTFVALLAILCGPAE